MNLNLNGVNLLFCAEYVAKLGNPVKEINEFADNLHIDDKEQVEELKTKIIELHTAFCKIKDKLDNWKEGESWKLDFDD